jgi:hypothetical protein
VDGGKVDPAVGSALDVNQATAGHPVLILDPLSWINDYC